MSVSNNPTPVTSAPVTSTHTLAPTQPLAKTLSTQLPAPGSPTMNSKQGSLTMGTVPICQVANPTILATPSSQPNVMIITSIAKSPSPNMLDVINDEAIILEKFSRTEHETLVARYVRNNQTLRARFNELEGINKRMSIKHELRKSLVAKFTKVFVNDKISVNSMDGNNLTIKELLSLNSKTHKIDLSIKTSIINTLGAAYSLENGKLTSIITNPHHPNHDKAKKELLKYLSIVESRLNNPATYATLPANHPIRAETVNLIHTERNYINDVSGF